MDDICAGCGKKKKIVTHRAGVPWCARCNMNDIRARASASKEAHGKGMELASTGMAKIEQWSELTTVPWLKEAIKKLLVILRALMVVELGGATPDEFAMVADLVKDENPFAAVIDPGEEPLDVEFDPQDEPPDDDDPIQAKSESATEDGKSAPASGIPSAVDSHEAEGRAPVSLAIDAEVAPPQSTPEIVGPPTDENAATTLVGVSGLVHNTLIREKWTLAEVESVRLRPGLDRQAQIEEARRQLRFLHGPPADVKDVTPRTAHEGAAAVKVGVSDEVRNYLLVEQEFTPAEVNSVVVDAGIDREAQIREALSQLEPES
jgi:hypothetical protein